MFQVQNEINNNNVLGIMFKCMDEDSNLSLKFAAHFLGKIRG
jgi:hypothetical protein